MSNPIPLNHKYGKIYTENQKEVVKKLSSGSYDLVSGYGWSFLVPFLKFCNMVNLFSIFSGVEAKGYQRQMFNSEILLSLYLFKVLLGIKYLNEVKLKLFTDIGLMKLLGFSTKDLKQGTNKRGKGKSKPLHKDSLGDGMSNFLPEEMEKLFNDVIKKLIKFGILKGKITAIVDGTNFETTELYEGRGKKTISHKKQDKKGKLVEIEEQIYGFKVIYLYDYQSRIPLSSMFKFFIKCSQFIYQAAERQERALCFKDGVGSNRPKSLPLICFLDSLNIKTESAIFANCSNFSFGFSELSSSLIKSKIISVWALRCRLPTV